MGLDFGFARGGVVAVQIPCCMGFLWVGLYFYVDVVECGEGGALADSFVTYRPAEQVTLCFVFELYCPYLTCCFFNLVSVLQFSVQLLV